MPVGHEEWWRDAKSELDSANSLKATGHRKQAYHHAGQAIEFALKAIYLRRKQFAEMPDECKSAKWHNLTLILNEAGLRNDCLNLKLNNRNCYENWLAVKDWRSDRRFPENDKNSVGVKEINDLMLAISHDPDGIMLWLTELYQAN